MIAYDPQAVLLQRRKRKKPGEDRRRREEFEKGPVSFTEKESERFWKNVKKQSGCWLWTKGLTGKGYGGFCVRGFTVRAHRAAYAMTFGSFDPMLYVCHRCDNPTCCNPEHLFLGTLQDNHADMCAKGRIAKGDRSGARLHPERIARGDKNGARLYPERLARGIRNGAYTKPECVRRGEKCNAILNDRTVITMRSLHFEFGVPITHIAELFGIIPQTASSAIRGKTWKHLPIPKQALEVARENA